MADVLPGLDRLVFVTVGTDGLFPFHRLVAWIDDWLRDAAPAGLECAIQHGTARAPARGRARPYLPYQEMCELVERAAVVVTHGGPATIQLCIDRGRKPIVVPRSPALGEVVDDHQAAFCRRIAAAQLAVLAEDEASLHDALDKAVADATVFRLEQTGGRRREVAETVIRLGELVDGLVDAHATRPAHRVALDGLHDMLHRGHRRQHGSDRTERP